jgi:hypothetical protein
MAQWNFNPGPTTGDIETDPGLGNDTVKVLNGTDGGFVVRQGFVIYDQNGAPVGSPVMPAGSWWVWMPTESAMRMGTVNSTTPWNPATNVGLNSFAGGNDCVARGDNTLAIGDNAQARALNSAALGIDTRAEGDNSLSVGNLTSTLSGSQNGFSSGRQTAANGDQAFTAGELTIANGTNSMAIGNLTTANGTAALAAGTNTFANGNNSFASGLTNDAGGANSFATGRANVADGTNSVAVGQGTSTQGGTNSAIATGFQTQANADHAFSMGNLTQANGTQSLATGHNTVANGIRSVTMGTATQTAITAPNALAIGDNTTCIGAHSFSSGTSTTASGDNSVTFGDNTQANNTNAIAMGQLSIASGQNSFAGGDQTQAQGDNSVALGFQTTASGINSLVHGFNSSATGDNALASGTSNVSAGNNSVALGRSVDALADNSTGIGEEIEILPVAQQSVVLGSGVIGNRLRSNRPASLISAFNTDHPTLFIASGSGPGTLGRIAIGGKGYFGMTNFNPLEVMEVWSGNLLQTNLDAISTDQPSTNVGQNHIGLTAPGTCDFFGYTTDNTQANPVPNIANSFVRIGLNDGATANTGPEIMWDDNAILEFKIDASTTSCSQTTVMAITDPNSFGVALSVYGDAFTTGSWTGSDLRFKENVNRIENADYIISKINGYTYDFKTNEFPLKNFSNSRSAGIMAQELKDVFPEAVKLMPDGYYAVAYDMLIPVLLETVKNQKTKIDTLTKEVQAIRNFVEVSRSDAIVEVESQNTEQLNEVIQEQKQMIDGLNLQIQEIKNCLLASGLCIGAKKNEQDVENDLHQFPDLYQNVPNPTSGITSIGYFIPEGISSIAIKLYTKDGRIIKRFNITESGRGTIMIDTTIFSSGVYFYSLEIKGETYKTLELIVN